MTIPFLHHSANRAGMSISIRPATPADLPLIGAFIRELAEYEKLAHEVRFDEAVLGAKLFGPRPMPKW
jgi:hypothetical protein